MPARASDQLAAGVPAGVPYAAAGMLLGLSFGVLARPVMGPVAAIVSGQRCGDTYGCDLAQGYLLARPMAVAQLEQWLTDRRARLAGTAPPL